MKIYDSINYYICCWLLCLTFTQPLGNDSMPYCMNTLKISSEHDIAHTISLLAKEQFRANDAYALDNFQFNIDAGENDVRAIADFDERQVRLFCRYANNLEKTDIKIAQFASLHFDICELAST